MEAYNQLRKTLGLKSSSNDNFAIAADEYKATKLVIGKDTEHAPEATFTRLNTRANDLLTVTFKYAKPATSCASCCEYHAYSVPRNLQA